MDYSNLTINYMVARLLQSKVYNLPMFRKEYRYEK